MRECEVKIAARIGEKPTLRFAVYHHGLCLNHGFAARQGHADFVDIGIGQVGELDT